MTNPNNAIGTSAAFGGRTSVNAFNEGINGIYTFAGVASGFTVSPKSGMTVSVGGNALYRDVAIAEDNAGNITTINNRSGESIEITIPAAPATGSRYDLIVAYVNNPATVTATDVDNPEACGIIVVSGNAATIPSVPADTAIRSAITADGGTGTTAYYARIASVRVAAGTTTIGSGMISKYSTTINGSILTNSSISSTKLASSAVTTAKIADSAVTSDKIDWTTFNTNYTSFLWNNDTIDIGTNTSGVDVPKLTWTCPEAGGYVVLAEGNIMQVGSTARYPRIGIYHNGNRVSYAAVSLPNSNYQLNWSAIWYGSFAKGSVVKVAASDGYDCRLFEGQHMIVFRIN